MKRDWSDYLNPVLVKEIRQYFHNRLLYVMTGLLLAGQLVVLLYMQTATREEQYPGAVFFYIIVAGIVIAAFLVCGLTTERRFAEERADKELDFSRTTPLSSFQIVWGKLAGALIMSCYLYALCLPFIVIAYFLRGIEMGDMLLATLFIFPAILLAAQIGILFGASGKRWMIWLYCAAMVWFTWSGGMFSFAFIQLTRHGFGMGALVICLQICFLLLILGLIFVISVAAVNHSAANRMLPTRIYWLGILLLAPVAALLMNLAVDSSDWQKFLFGGIMTGGFIAVSGCATLAAFERDNAGWRVTRRCPRQFFKRLGYFLISSGWSGGILLAWLMLLAMIAMLGLVAFVDSAIVDTDFQRTILGLVSAILFFIGCAEFAIYLHLNSKLPGWAWWLIIQFSLSVLGMLFGIQMAGTPLRGGSSGDLSSIFILFAFVLSITGFFCLCNSLRKQFKTFHPDTKPDVLKPPAPEVTFPTPTPKPIPVPKPPPKPVPVPVEPPAVVAESIQPVTTEQSKTAGDSWNCWLLQCLRQLRHNHFILYVGILSILFQLLLLYIHSQIRQFSRDSNMSVALLYFAAFGMLVCINQTFAKTRTMFSKESPMVHFLAYSPYQSASLLKGLILSHAVLYFGFLLISGLSWLVFLITYPEDFGNMVRWGAHIYLLSLMVVVLLATYKVRLDTLMLWIAICCLTILSSEIWAKSWGGVLVLLPFVAYLLEWFRSSLLPASRERELGMRIGQAVLLLTGLLVAFICPDEKFMVIIPIIIAAMGSVASMSGSLDSAGIPANRRKPLWFFWGNASSGAWLWAWLVNIAAFLILDRYGHGAWNALPLSALCAGELAYLLAKVNSFFIRCRLDSLDKVYNFFSSVLTLAILAGCLLVALIMMTDPEIIFTRWSTIGWVIAAISFFFLIPRFRKDFKLCREARKNKE